MISIMVISIISICVCYIQTFQCNLVKLSSPPNFQMSLLPFRKRNVSYIQYLKLLHVQCCHLFSTPETKNGIIVVCWEWKCIIVLKAILWGNINRLHLTLHLPQTDHFQQGMAVYSHLWKCHTVLVGDYPDTLLFQKHFYILQND